MLTMDVLVFMEDASIRVLFLELTTLIGFDKEIQRYMEH